MNIVLQFWRKIPPIFMPTPYPLLMPTTLFKFSIQIASIIGIFQNDLPHPHCKEGEGVLAMTH